MPETPNAFGEPYAVWDNQKKDYLIESDGTLRTFKRKQEAETFLYQAKLPQSGIHTKNQKQESCFVKESQSTALQKHDDIIKKGTNEDEQEMEPFSRADEKRIGADMWRESGGSPERNP